jgi:predicted O-methyltransferase YrrM
MIDELTKYAAVHMIPTIQAEGAGALEQLILDNGCRRILEIGSAIGKTAINLAMLDEAITVTTIEKDPELARLCRENIKTYHLQDRVTSIEGDALETEIQGPFDCIFIDAAKAQYRRFFVKYAPLLADNGIIVSDNMNFHGMVQHPEMTNNRHTKALIRRLKEYRTFLESLEDYDTVILESGDGIAVTRKKR